MRILWLVNNLCEAVECLTENGRACGWLYSLCRQLRQQNDVELHIAFIWGQKHDEFDYNGVVYHPIYAKGITSRAGRMWNRIQDRMSNKRDILLLRQCMSIIHDVSPDIIHIHGSEDMFGLITQSRDVTCPVVLSIQGLLSSIKLKFYSGLTRSDISYNEPLWKKIILSGFNGVYRDFRLRADREIVIFKTLQNVIGRTQWDRRCAIALNPQVRYFTVNEILRPEFLSSSWSPRQQQDCFVIATTISSGIFKGLEVIYQAARLLTDVHFPFEWKVLGLTSDDEMVRMVEKIFHIHAQDVHLQLMGSKRANEIVHVLQHSDLYVQASHIENSPNSVCEAMALGMPIVASCAGGTSSMLQNGVEGVIIQDGNHYELAGAIIETKRNYAQSIKMGEKARARALPRHNPDNVVRELMSTYNTIINESK